MAVDLPSPLHRISPEEYRQLVAAGVFERTRASSSSTASLVSSQRRDLRDKPRIYASAGVPVYWVVDVDAGRAVAHSSPRGEAYERVDVVGPDGELDASHLALPPMSVADLLAAASG